MKTAFAISIILCVFLLFANTIDSRKDLGEYWRNVITDHVVRESTQGLLPVNLAAPIVFNSNANYRTSQDFENQIEKPFAKDFNDVKPTEQKSFLGDFEPRPDATIYVNNVKPTEQKSFLGDFEPRPDATIYVNNVKPTEQKSFDGDFEPWPDATIYHNDIKPTMGNHFLRSKPIKPDLSIYHN